MKMAKGDCDGYTYFLSNKFVNETEEQLNVRLPENFVVKLKNGKTGDEAQLSVSEYAEEVGGKGENDYSVFRKPSGNNNNDFENFSKKLSESGAFKIPTNTAPPVKKPASGGNGKGGM